MLVEEIMPSREIITYLFILLLPEFTRSGLVTICAKDSGNSTLVGLLHCGHVNRVADMAYKKEGGVRSKVECAVNCYSNTDCLTAVYEKDRNCLLTDKTFKQLDVLNFSSNLADCTDDDIIEMRSSVAGTSISCPSECTGYSTCAADCTGINQTTGCMDTTTEQYDAQPSCEFEPPIRSDEYYLKGLGLNFLSVKDCDSYDVFTVNFTKTYSWSILKVKWRGSISPANNPGTSDRAVDRWRVLFNEVDCSNPGAMVAVFYQEDANFRHVSSMGFQGVCYGLPSGSLVVTFRVEMKYRDTKFRVGLRTAGSRVYIEELSLGTPTHDPTVASCPSLSVFNTRQHTFQGGSDSDGGVKSFNYMKVEDDTGLKINVNSQLGINIGSEPQGLCALFSVKIDGIECSPTPIGVEISSENAYDVTFESRFTEFQGHCHGVASGLHKISLHVSTCNGGIYPLKASTGYSTRDSWILVEEFRNSSNIMAAMAADGVSIYRIPQFNIITESLYQPSIGLFGESGLWTVGDYNKTYGESGLLLMMSGSVAAIGSSSLDRCCRYYFKINDLECSIPGPIEGTTYIPSAEQLHGAIMVEGICDGVASGSVTIALWAGRCRGSQYDADVCMLGVSGHIHMMAAETFIKRETITVNTGDSTSSSG